MGTCFGGAGFSRPIRAKLGLFFVGSPPFSAQSLDLAGERAGADADLRVEFREGGRTGCVDLRYGDGGTGRGRDAGRLSAGAEGATDGSGADAGAANSRRLCGATPNHAHISCLFHFNSRLYAESPLPSRLPRAIIKLRQGKAPTFTRRFLEPARPK